ncbi:MAG: uracil-DNA glycosylase [Endomicrobiaceae bacterium]|nr:uracil-DNA glycosylase [Endomicrobiaceae bacterium]
MKQSEYIKLLRLVRTSIEEYKNWGEEELVLDKIMQIKSSDKKEVKAVINKIGNSEQTMKKQDNIQVNKQVKQEEPVIQKNIQSKNAEQKLEDLKKQIVNCKKCELGKYRLNAVCGSGDPYANIMFVGEGPGFQEDHEGKPFIGRAGDLLTKIIEAMGYKRESVYIANIVKCHPMKNPENPELKGNDRPPTPEEMQCCQPFLDEQIRIISPKVIITLGASSTRALLKTDDVISSLRGKLTEYMGIPLMPTYHPAALLRNPKLKKDVWHDMQKVMALVKKKG